MNFPGNCFVNHDNKKMWIDIPKNASKSIGWHLRRSPDWKNANYIQDKIYDYKTYAIVKDPIQRWRGSTIELAFHFLFHNKYDYSLLGEWFKVRDWKNFESKGDIHHFNIEYYTQGLNDIVWIPIDDKFEETVCNYLEINEPLVKLNSTEENEHKKHIEPHLDKILSDLEFINKLKNFYARDYEILNSVLTNHSICI